MVKLEIITLDQLLLIFNMKKEEILLPLIHQWNIDGKSEYEILNTLQEMTMACAAYKDKSLKEEKLPQP